MERLWRLNRTLIEKLDSTGYDISSKEREAVKTLLDFEMAFPKRELLERVFLPRAGTLASERSPSGILLFFSDPGDGKRQIGVDEVRRLHHRMEGDQVQLALFITGGVLSSKARQELARTQAPGLARIITFEDRELLFNVSKHRRVPKHELISPSEAKLWLATTGLRRSQLPRLFADDAMCKWVDALPNDLIKVTCYSPTIGKSIRYLVVVTRTEK